MSLRYIIVNIIIAFLLLWPSEANAIQVELVQTAVNDTDDGALGAVNSDTWLVAGSAYSTVSAPFNYSSYRFAYWTVSSYPSSIYRDAWGRSTNPVSFILLEETTARAHYLPTTRDSDSDGIPDWYEMEYFGTLENNATSDTDGDGLALAQEYAGGTNPLYANASQTGGIAYADSASVTCNLAGYPTYVIRSVPAGTVNQTAIVTPGTVITTVSLSGNAAFGYWTLDGVRQQDAWGVAIPQVTFTMGTANRECVAYMFAGDTDGDGVADAYEQYYYGTLTNNGTSDTDGDGITLLAEKSGATNPLYANASQPGGISWADSTSVTVNLADYSRYTLRSVPSGSVDQSAFVPTNTAITTPSLAGNATFGYWALDGVRQQDAWGVAYPQVTFTVQGTNREGVAYLFPGDSDGDGIPDAYEQYTFGTLSNDASADVDGDGLTLAQEYTGGTNPLHANATQAGGVSWADSALVLVNMQFHERLGKVLVNGALVDFFSPNPSVASGIQIGAEAAPAVADWDGDGDFDLFCAHAAGLRVFRNIGTSGNPDFEEVMDGFGGMASHVAALDRPMLAGGDWNGDGKGDFVIGGNTDSLRFVLSGGGFTSDGTGFDLVTDSSVSIPALGDFNGDNKPDLLVLLADGTVRFYANSGLATPYANPGVDNYLGTAVPNATGISCRDLGQDGLCDVLVADSNGRIWEFHLLPGGGFSLVSKVWGGSGAGFAAGMTLATCDLENDGDTDLIAGLANGGLLAMRDPGAGRPAEVVAAAGVDSVKLAWDANKQSRIRGYNVFRSTSAEGPFEQVTPTPIALPSFLDRNVTPGTTYRYYVRGLSYYYLPGNSAPLFVQTLPSDQVVPNIGTVRLNLQSVNGRPGSYVQVPISLANPLGLRGQDLAISMTYDPQILVPAAQANLTKETVLRTGLSQLLGITDNGELATGILTISGTSGQIFPGSGKLFMLQFRIRETAPGGKSTPLTITSATLKAVAGYQAVVDFSGNAEVSVDMVYQPGDLTGDGLVTAADDTLLQALIKPKARKPTVNELRAGDINGNGLLDYPDVILLKRLLAGLPLNIEN